MEDIRQNAQQWLKIFSSKDEQRAYTASGNQVVPDEFIIMWFEVYKPLEDAFAKTFSQTEKEALAEFSALLELHAQALPDTLSKLHTNEAWISIMHKAERTLWKMLPNEKDTKNLIVKARVTPLLLEACPSFEAVYNASDSKDSDYAIAGEFADHLLTLYQNNKISEFPDVVKFIERMHLEGDNYVKELATIGYLEGIQNVWSHTKISPEEFGKLLLPESRRYWHELNAFWRSR